MRGTPHNGPEPQHGGPHRAARKAAARSLAAVCFRIGEEKAIQTLYETDEGTFHKVFEALKSFLSDLKAAIKGTFAKETVAMEESIRQCEGIVDVLSDRANIYFAVGTKPSASVLVIFDYDKDKKTRRSFKVYKNASFLNDKLKELEVMYYNGKSEETIWDAIDQAVQRKELLSFNSESHYFSSGGSSGRRSYSVSEGSIEGHREGAGRNRVQNSGLVSRGSGYRAVTDRAYLAAVNSGDMETAQRMVDEAAKEAGYTERGYHGSKKGGGFTVFRDWQYFTKNKEYAERYTERDNANSLYNVFWKSKKPFDTRLPEVRKLYEKEFLGKYSNTGLMESGLPDWTDGYDLVDFFEENGYDFDSILLDEGGDPTDSGVKKRGISYVIRDSSQIKSADPITYDDNGDIIPLSQRFNEEENDIRFSLSDVPAKDLVRENRELKRLVEDLEAQFTVTRGKRISNTRIQSIARAIKSEYTSDISTFEIVDALRALNNYLAASKTTSGTEVFNEFAKLALDMKSSLRIMKYFCVAKM